MSESQPQATKFSLSLVVAGVLLALFLYLIYYFAPSTFLAAAPDDSTAGIVLRIVAFMFSFALAFVLIRLLIGELLFGLLAKRKQQGRATSRLARDTAQLLLYIVSFALLFNSFFPNVPLGALFASSTVIGVILGLALQDTLGNLFSGVSLQADKPFQVGDVITVGKYMGVVESITWRAVKIRSFTNHIILVSNASIAKESIEVCAREDLNARLTFFSALYSDSPAKVIAVVREAVRDTENVSPRMTPIIRIRNLGDSSVDYEAKYWLEDYARFNDTDALVRQRIWYAFRRAGLTFAFPTRTLHVERTSARKDGRRHTQNDFLERLAAVELFAPLSETELAQLAANTESHVYAPNEAIIRQGDAGDSMFVVNKGTVRVVGRDGAKTVAELGEGAFFGEMALLTGEPRAASVVADEETEVLEIKHEAMRELFQNSPDLVESLSHTITERRAGLAAQQTSDQLPKDKDGIVNAIKRFFRLD